MNRRSFNQFVIVALAAVVCALPVAMPQAAFAKDPTCKQEAKKAGITDKKEMKKYMAECKKKRIAAKKGAAPTKKAAAQGK